MYPNVQLFINGQWCAALSGRTIPVVNPATHQTIGTVAFAEQADLDRALEAAEAGFKVWRQVSAFDRSKVLRKAAQLLRERYGFKGELRAVGDILLDQLQMLARCGFDTFEIKDGPTLQALQEGRAKSFTRFYQPSLLPEAPAGTRPWLRQPG